MTVPLASSYGIHQFSSRRLGNFWHEMFCRLHFCVVLFLLIWLLNENWYRSNSMYKCKYNCNYTVHVDLFVKKYFTSLIFVVEGDCWKLFHSGGFPIYGTPTSSMTTSRFLNQLPTSCSSCTHELATNQSPLNYPTYTPQPIEWWQLKYGRHIQPTCNYLSDCSLLTMAPSS